MILGCGRDKDRHSVHEFHHIRVADPVGYGNDDLITGVQDCGKVVVEGVLASGRDKDVLDLCFQIVLVAEIAAYGLAQFENAGHCRVAAKVCVNGCLGSFANVFRGGEIRLANGQACDHNALVLELQGLGIHGQGQRRFDLRQSV